MVNEIPVPDESGENIIYIRPRMKWGVKNRVQGTAARIQMDMNAGKPLVLVTTAAYQVALMLNNIIRWEGPALKDFKLNEAGLDDLDPDHGDAVLNAINAANKAKTSPNPKPPTATISTSDGATNTPAG
jgi:hypothetical protein